MHYFKVFHNHTTYTHETRLGEQNIDPWLFQKPIINIILLLAGVTDLNLFSSIVTYPLLNLLKQELTRIGSHTFNFIRFSVFSLDTLTVRFPKYFRVNTWIQVCSNWNHSYAFCLQTSSV